MESMEVEVPGVVNAPTDKHAWRDISRKTSPQLLEEINRILEEEHRSMNCLLASRHKDVIARISKCFAKDLSDAEDDVEVQSLGERNQAFVSQHPHCPEDEIEVLPLMGQHQAFVSPVPVPSQQPSQDPEAEVKCLKSSKSFASAEEEAKQPRKIERTAVSLLSKIVMSKRFDIFFTFLIFLNCVTMAFELQYNGSNYGHTWFDAKESMDLDWAKDFLDIMDWFFGILFTIELMANITVKRLSFFLQPELEDEFDDFFASKHASPIGDRISSSGLRKGVGVRCDKCCSRFCECFSRIDWWGVLDFVVVISWLLYVISHAGLPFDPMFMRLARLAKLLRFLKVVKTVSSFDSLYLLTTTIQGSISALFWSVILLLVVQALLSFILCQQLAQYYESTEQKFDDRKQIWLYFGTYTRALFSMFEVTLGNWVPVGRALMDKVNVWFFIFSLMHKFIIGFAVVNVMNGVFMQTTFKVAATDDQIMIRQREKASRTHREKMEKLFNRGDKDGSGYLQREEFMKLLFDPALRKWMASMELSIFKEEDVDAVFTLFAHEDNQISLDELVTETARLKGPARTIDIELRFQEVLNGISSLERCIKKS